MKFNTLTLAVALAVASQLAISTNVLAQTDTTSRRDSLRVYRMGEITVGGEREREIKTVTAQQIPLAKIQRSDAGTAEQLALQIPAGQVRTNSRGESLVFLRGVGERQVAVFFDGALMNIPWDNRIDLAMLPLNAVGAISVTKGVPSILYGANVTGGVVSFVSQEQPTDGIASDIGVQLGEHGYLNTYYTNLGASGAFNYVASLGYTRRDGVRLPAGALTPYSQIGREERTNTDQQLMNGYVRGEYKFSDRTTAGLSFNYISGEKGIPAEAHIPGEDARFWRYPDYSNFHTILNLESHLTDAKDLTLRGAAWFNRFAQTVDQFTDSTYSLKGATQQDHDGTVGARVILRKQFGSNTLDLSVNGLSSSHDQKDFGYDSRGAANDAPTLSYKQNIYSAGLEYQAKLTHMLKLIAGGTYDIMNTPETGGKPSQGSFTDYSAMLGLGYALNDYLSVRANAGRKTRFPTMREMYGEALGAFVINPDLHAERTNIIEAGITGAYDWGRFDLAGFDYITDGTIERVNVTIDGKRFRKRVNLEGSTNPGIEASAFISELRPLTIEASVTYMQPRSTKENKDGSKFLAERPEVISFLTLDYTYEGIQPTLELSYTKPGYSLVDDSFIELPAYTTLNARLAYRFFFQGITAQVFIRANNLTDAVQLNQIGLPGAGRELQGGVKVLF